MAAKCYHCNVGSGTIPGTTRGEAVGCCQICHILACPAHAVRDATYPRWICVSCDTSLLAASAAAASTAARLADLLSSILFNERDFYRTLDEFVNRRPQLEWLRADVTAIIAAADQRLRVGEAGRLWKPMSPEGKRLLAAAMLMAQRLELRSGDLVEGLRVVLEGYARGQ